MNTAALNANVRAEMVRRGETQVTLAAKLHVTQPTLSRRLRGEADWTINDLYRLAEVLQVPLSALLPGPDRASA